MKYLLLPLFLLSFSANALQVSGYVGSDTVAQYNNDVYVATCSGVPGTKWLAYRLYALQSYYYPSSVSGVGLNATNSNGANGDTVRARQAGNYNFGAWTPTVTVPMNVYTSAFVRVFNDIHPSQVNNPIALGTHYYNVAVWCKKSDGTLVNPTTFYQSLNQ